MRLDADEARRRFGESRVARFATTDADGRPHLVPIVFALADGDVLYSAVDRKPKTTTALKRIANFAANPRVSLLADYYVEDWEVLWWVRADAMARIATGTEAETALALLTSKYGQYVDDQPTGPVLALEVDSWTGWSAS